MVATYSTTLDLARYLAIEQVLPNRELVSVDRPKETVGTGDDSANRFFLDHAKVLASSYTLYYGATETATATLTETTHYTLTKDRGQIDLTSAGVTALSTNSIYADYSYTVSLTDTQLQSALDRAQDEIDSRTNQHWMTVSDTTPDYAQVTNEKHTGQGAYARDYYPRNYPIPDVSTTLTTAVTAGDTSIVVGATTGFPTAGFLTIDSDKIQYTGKATTSFTGCTSVSAHATTGVTIFPYVVEVSTTGSGTAPSWTPQKPLSDYDLDFDTGRIHLYNTAYDSVNYAGAFPGRLVPDRLRITYNYGNSTIPADIKRVCLMIASKDLLHTTVRNSTVSGQDGFNPSLVNVDEDWIEKTIMGYMDRGGTNL